MAYIKRENRKFYVVDSGCIGRPCFSPGSYQHRGATSYGSKDSGASDMCMRNAYHGCPIPTPAIDPEITKQRKKCGMKVVY